MLIRKNEGSTLALTAACTIIIILVAVGLWFLMLMMGGSRELSHATDSGTLNVAKQALISPSAQFTNPNSKDDIADMNAILGGAAADPNSTPKVNLLTFNRLVGQSLLVAMNAEADGNAAALANARALIDLVEGENGNNGGKSIGQDLRDKLSDASADSNWAKTDFESTGGAYSLRMFGNDTQIKYQNADFKGLYVSDSPQTNVAVDDIQDNLPFNNFTTMGPAFDESKLNRAALPTGAAVNAPAGSTATKVLSGYKPIAFNAVNRNIYAVPLETSPHLVSLHSNNNAANTIGPGDADALHKTVLPPNAFLNGALGFARTGPKKDFHQLAIATTGTSQAPFSIGIPYGYIVVDNRGADPSFSGLVPNSDTVFAHELATGISVDQSGYFSTNGAIENWESQPRVGPDGTEATWNPDNMGPPVDGAFDPNGNPLSDSNTSDRRAVDQNVKHNNTNVICTDVNSDASDLANFNAQCVGNASPGGAPNGQDIFDYAYHNGKTGTNFDGSQVTTNSITDGEALCFKMLDFWEHVTKNSTALPLYASGQSDEPSGLRLYPIDANGNVKPANGVQTPYVPKTGGFAQAQDHGYGGNNYSDNTYCQVTKDGNLAQLIDQTALAKYDKTGVALSNEAKTVEKLIRQRMNEILPNGATQYDAVVKTKKLSLGTVNFIYLKPDGKTFQMTTAAPPWFSKTSTLPKRAESAKHPSKTRVQPW